MLLSQESSTLNSLALKLAYMTIDSLSDRLAKALGESALTPVALAAASRTSEATISNWLNGKVQLEHVKASMLLRIAGVLNVRPQWLLFGEGRQHESWHTAEADSPAYDASHPVKPEALTIALQLVDEALDKKGRTLPPPKRAELTTLVYELLVEGMPEAKVLRFALAAAA